MNAFIIRRAVRIGCPLTVDLGQRTRADAKHGLPGQRNCGSNPEGRQAMKVVGTMIALLLSSSAVAQECQTCSSADACMQTYVKATTQAQREVKQAIRDWRENLDRKASGELF